jgi:hypothetical protein
MLGKTVAVVVLLASSGAAMAAGVVYSDRAAFEAAVGPHKTYTFDVAEGFPPAPAPIMFVDGTFPQLTSNGGPASLDVYGPAGNQALTGRLNDQLNRSTLVSIFVEPSQNVIGFDILDLGSALGEVATIVVNDGSDRLTIPYHIPDNDANPATPVFFGVIWDTDITWVDVWGENLLCAGPGTCFAPNLIDNLTIVPEPGAAMLALCAGSIATLRRPNVRR